MKINHDARVLSPSPAKYYSPIGHAPRLIFRASPCPYGRRDARGLAPTSRAREKSSGQVQPRRAASRARERRVPPEDRGAWLVSARGLFDPGAWQLRPAEGAARPGIIARRAGAPAGRQLRPAPNAKDARPMPLSREDLPRGLYTAAWRRSFWAKGPAARAERLCVLRLMRFGARCAES